MKKTLIIVYSYHHGNTEKIAKAMAERLNADLKYPQDASTDDLKNYDIIGFGAGIDSGKHYKPLLDFAETLPQEQSKKAFIFSTGGIYTKKKSSRDHAALRAILLSKGYTIAGEFGCLGLDTNSVLKYFGGINKGRPNKEDFDSAKSFADSI